MGLDQRDSLNQPISQDQQLRALAQCTEEYAIVTLDVDGRITSWNEGAERMKGWRGHEVLGRHVSVFYPAEAVAEGKPAAGLRLAREHWVFRDDAERMRKNGSRFLAQVTITALCDANGVLKGFAMLTRDISKRKRTEVALQESEARMRLALDASGAGVWSWDAATDVNRVDGAYRALYGFGPEEPITTATWKARLHPQDRGKHRRRIEAALAHGDEWSEEARIVHPELGERWLGGRGKILRDASGRVIGMTGVDFDITARKLAEAALRQNEERLEQAVAVANLGFFDHDHVGSALYCSPRLKEICGCRAEDPMTFEDYIATIHPEDRERITAAIARAHDPAGDGGYAVERRVLRSDGSVRWVIARSKTTFEGEDLARHPVRTIGAVVDITERKMAEAVLKENAALAEQLSKIAASAPGVICSFRLTAEGKASFPYAAPSMKDVYGLDPESVREDAQAIFGRTHPQDIERLNASVAASALTLSPWHATFRYRHPTKGDIWLDAHSSPVPEPDGSIIWHGFVQDVTARAKAEEKQSLLVSELDHRVKNILARIAVVIERSREGSRSIDEFLRAVEGRIHSMAQTHSRLSRSRWTGVNVAMLIEDELEPYRTPSNTVVKGPGLMLRPEAAQIIGMVLHELATNAAKYGALSSEAGRVTVGWDEQTRDGKACLEFVWRESGGPAVSPPNKVSYGTSVIRQLVGHELGGLVRLEFARDGITCEIRIPHERVIAR